MHRRLVISDFVLCVDLDALPYIGDLANSLLLVLHVVDLDVQSLDLSGKLSDIGC